MTGGMNDDAEIDRMLRAYRTLSPEQRHIVVGRVIERARRERARVIRDLFRSIFDWFRRRAAVAQLQRMDDRMLKDIGLHRGDIEGAVRGPDQSRRLPSMRSTAKVPDCIRRKKAEKAA